MPAKGPDEQVCPLADGDAPDISGQDEPALVGEIVEDVPAEESDNTGIVRAARVAQAAPSAPPASLARVVPRTAAEAAEFAEMDEGVRRLQDEARAHSTRKAYDLRRKAFVEWCTAKRLVSCPAEPSTVCRYLTIRSKPREDGSFLSLSSLEIDRAAISEMHTTRGLQSPCKHPEVERLWDGIRRELGTPQEGKDALSPAEIGRLCDALSTETLVGLRDRAVILVGFAGAFRRSELAALNVADLSFAEDHLRILVRRSKTDKTGKGMEKFIHAIGGAYCPVAALRRWLEAAAITRGAVFRKVHRLGMVAEDHTREGGKLVPARLTPQTVWRIVTETAARAGLDASRFGAHSLRSGFVTAATDAGIDPKTGMEQTGHKKADTYFKYVKRRQREKTNLTADLGLGGGKKG
jgi:integrase